MIPVIIAAVAALIVFSFFVARTVRRKNVDIIFAADLRRRKEAYDGTRHVFFCVTDHFEPFWHNNDETLAKERVTRWCTNYPKLVDRFRDNGGRPPRHAFFYPQEEYVPEYLDMLAGLQRAGFGEVEIHLHHDNDTAEGLREKLLLFKSVLHTQHGLLHVDPSSGDPVYAFIHGNWTLNDSGADGRYCGVKDELVVLKETGCYADFTYPSAPHPTQPPIINSIYYAKNIPGRARSHFKGTAAAYKKSPEGDLLLFQGPLALNWGQRRRGLFPAVENGDITGKNPPTRDRIDLWVETAVSVRRWPRWVFIKAYTHGAQEQNAGLLLSRRGADLYEYLVSRYNDGRRFVLHFSTPWEMYRCVKALERGDGEAIRQIESFEYDF